MTSANGKTQLTIRGRIVLVLASLALGGAWMTDDEHARLAAALLLAPLIVDGIWKSVRMPPVAVTATTRRCVAGATFVERLVVESLSTRRTLHACEVREPRTAIRGAPATIELLPPRGRVTVEFPCRARGRGRWRQRLFVLDRTYPLGLVRQRTIVTVDSDFIVEPARVTLGADVLHSVAERPTPTQRSRRPGDDEFHALREYMAGEDARRVHALRSVAVGTLVRRVDFADEGGRVHVVLDLRRPYGMPAMRGNRHLEWGVSATATLLDEFAANARRCILWIVAEPTNALVLDVDSDKEAAIDRLAEVRESAHAPFPHAWLRTLDLDAEVYWVPAGGHRSNAEFEALPRPPVVLEYDG